MLDSIRLATTSASRWPGAPTDNVFRTDVEIPTDFIDVPSAEEDEEDEADQVVDLIDGARDG